MVTRADRIVAAPRRAAGAVGLAMVMVLATSLRFAGLDGQSFWYDEIATLEVLRGSLPETLQTLRASESTPPLYYVLAWGWTQVFGEAEAGLRSLSALLGLAAVPLIALCANTLGGRPSAFAAAAIAAVNPMLVWYSQEGRAYSLLVLLASASLLSALHVWRAPTRRWLALWAATCVGLVLTHYFGAFLVLAELAALLLIAARARRGVLLASIPTGLAGLAVLPLALGQEDGRTAWIGGSPLAGRLGDVLQEALTLNTALVSSNSAAPGTPIWILAAVALAVILAVGRHSLPLRSPLALILGFGLGVPLLLALTPLDFFKDRNLIYLWPVLVVLIGVLIGSRSRDRPVVVAAVLLVLAQSAITLRVATTDRLQRNDWRSATAELGPASVTRAVIVMPDYEAAVLRHYGRSLTPITAPARVRELVLVGPQVDLEATSATLPPGASLIANERVQHIGISRIRLPTPIEVTSKSPALLELSAADAAYLADLTRHASRWTTALRSLPDPQAAEVVRRSPAAIRALGPAPAALPAVAEIRRRLLDAGRLSDRAARNPSQANVSSALRALVQERLK